MITIKEAATEFLAHKRIAVTGVSRNPQGHGSNAMYQRLRDRGYQVFAINPNANQGRGERGYQCFAITPTANQVEGDRCYPDLTSVPGGVEAVVIGTRPETA